jgi:heme-degrading monooxygenase HmoA
MFVNVGRFHFRPMSQDERQHLIQRIEQDIPPIVRQSPGFRGVYFVSPTPDEVMTVWLWDSESDWDAAFARMGPHLQEYVVPNLDQPPDRAGGSVVLEIMP